MKVLKNVKKYLSSKMSSKNLYQDLILDHATNPRNKEKLNFFNKDTEGFNRLCGDNIHVFIHENNTMIDNISFLGNGCAICIASASLMTETLKGKLESDAMVLINYFLDLVKNKNNEESIKIDKVNQSSLEAFKSIVDFPMRVNCATLPWITAETTIKNKNKKFNIEDYK